METKQCRCGSIRGEMRRADGWLYCGNCRGRIGDYSEKKLRFVCLTCHAVIYAAVTPKACACGGREFAAPAATLRVLEMKKGGAA